MAETLVRFAESPFSPWRRATLSRGSQPRTHSAELRCIPTVHGFQTVGGIRRVNALASAQGLEQISRLPRLVAEEREEQGMIMERERGGGRARTAQKTSSEKTDASEKADDKALLIELAVFPGYDPERPTRLPHGLIAMEQMKRVTRAQMKLSMKRDGFRDCWKNLFYSEASQAVFLDTFWWYFLQRYQENRPIQDKIFSRVAKNYVSLLCEMGNDPWGDAFFKMYPNAVAQSVYTAFIHAFPASWASFDDHFKAELCKTVALWQSGSKSLSDAWRRWDLDVLEPPNLLKHIGKEDTSSTTTHKRGFNLDALVKDAKANKPTRQRPRLVGPSRGGVVTGGRHAPSSSSSLSRPSSSRLLPSSRASLSVAHDHTYSHLPGGQNSRTLSFASIERALSEGKGHLRHEASVPTSPSTLGEATPPVGSTATQQRKIEVAREQLLELKSRHNKRRRSKQTAAAKKTAETAKKGGAKGGTGGKPDGIDPPDTSTDESADEISYSPPDVRERPTAHVSSSESPPWKGTKRETDKAGKPRHPSNQESPSLKTSPGSTKQEVGGGSKQQVGGDRRRGSSDGVPQPDSGTWKEKALAMRSSREDPAPVPVVGPQFEHNVFDIHGHSPLVKHYLQRKSLSYDEGFTQLTRRTEVAKEAPADALSYKEVLEESAQQDKRTQAQLKRQHARHKQAQAYSQRQRKKATAKHEQDVKKVLSNKREVHQLSTELTSHIAGRQGPVDKTAVSSAISQSLDRVSKR